ncbi:MAG: hypothetical protein L6R42_001158 [Xanthoria sp. 1 TBL-2021]|nr:MAG: hypothetical protein L6R42_001158 [Xanthoria sp. 1 TBL-2021]
MQAFGEFPKLFKTVAMAFDRIHSSAASLLLTISVPKNRRILDLNNVPLVSGTSYVKWHLPSSTSAEHRGRTSKEAIREHKVAWEYDKLLPVRMTIDRNALLQESEIHFQVMQEYSSGARGERIILGNVRLNLAEYVDAGEDGDGNITRRYLMQDSKINSTLKIGISMKQTEGDRNFMAPPLKSAPVFGGIAGIMTAEQGQGDDFSHMPSMSSKTREAGKLQDVYRKTLAASWAAQEGELPADECIEDIFAGGDGWGKALKKNKKTMKPSRGSTDGEESDADRATLKAHHRNTSSAHATHPNNKSKGHLRPSSRSNNNSESGISGRASIEQQTQSSSTDTTAPTWRRADEIDEFTAREDLRSWEISTPK